MLPISSRSAAAGTDDIDSGAMCLAVVLGFHGLAADPRQIAREHAPIGGGMDVLHLVRAARRLGLKARSVQSSIVRLSRLSLPAVAEMRDAGFMVLARVAEDRVLVQEGSCPPRLLGIEEFEASGPGGSCS